nr:trihelix transcription factor GTL1-like [Ipomoea batatas]
MAVGCCHLQSIFMKVEVCRRTSAAPPGRRSQETTVDALEINRTPILHPIYIHIAETIHSLNLIFTSQNDLPEIDDMNSDFEMAELMHRQKPAKKKFMAENASSPSLSSYFPVNSSHTLLQQANPFSFTQPFFQEHHFVPPFFDPVREHSNSSNLLLPLSFKLGSSGDEIGQRNNALGCARAGDDDAPLHRNCHGGDSPDAMIQCWENQEDSALKQRFWKPLSTEFPNGNEKECPKENDDEEKRKEEEISRHETEEKNKFSFFDGELEAIYRQADIAETAQTASGSALTAENFPAKLFESLVKRVMDHQEELHSKFLETMERLERERVGREEAWRKQEVMNLEREANDRANQKALASSREAAILSYLEKITGQKITLPTST